MVNEVLLEWLVNGGYIIWYFLLSSWGLVFISSGGKCNYFKLVKGFNYFWFL